MKIQLPPGATRRLCGICWSSRLSATKIKKKCILNLQVYIMKRDGRKSHSHASTHFIKGLRCKTKTRGLQDGALWDIV